MRGVALHMVVLSGGAGTRFWPLSRRGRPKQLLTLGGEAPLIAATLARVRPLAPPERWWLVAGETYAAACHAAVPETPAAHVLSEPKGANTAPAIALAALRVEQEDPDAVMVVLPADHHVQDAAALCAALSVAADLAHQGGIVTLGVVPRHVETGYGYIERGAPVPGGFAVRRFVEKPGRAEAEALIADKQVYWNAGIFVMRPAVYLAELARHLPRTHTALREVQAAVGSAAYEKALRRAYAEVDAVSIDHGIMEKAQGVCVVPVECGWSDIGSFSALGGRLPPDESGNVKHGRAVALDVRDSVLYAEGNHVVAVLGVKGLVVVHTPDATLVVPAERAQEVRKLVAKIEKAGWAEHL
ncbi:MAG: mannose-1-phosphate guanylyltransferase [Deltaproteobacteria bacterium]|nr:mannose-1-phosphate guanylyltransferase [Deltaproteobacteria bacterium]